VWQHKNKVKTNAQAKVKRAADPRRFKGYHLKKEFGITLHQFELMVKEQNNLCFLCDKPETAIDARTGRVKDLAVDHCHNTLKVRRLLCWVCNTGIGKLLHSPKLLRKAADYLEEYA
jgi:hypothetical protein